MPLCPHCGTENPEGATTCSSCGQPMAAAPTPPPSEPTPPPESAPITPSPEPPTGGPEPPWPPWEDGTQPFTQRLIDTIKSVVTEPVAFYQRLKPSTGDWIKPYLFALICGYVGGIAGAVYSTLFSFGMASFMPSSMRGMGLFSGTSIVMTLIITPFTVAIGLLIGTLLFHLLLSIFGGASQGIEATYRTIAYAYTSSLAGVIPFLGGLIQFFWVLFLMIVGLREVHKTTTGKAAAAVLIPVLVCAACALVAVGILGVAIFQGLRQM